MKSPASLRADFPLLKTQFEQTPLVYLDSGATSQKPSCVIDAINQYYREQNANVHRGIHTLSEQATSAYEATRSHLAQCLSVNPSEIVWTKGATEAINLIAHGLRETINSSDTIVISALEHHANIVPWQQLCQKTGATLVILPIDEQGVLETEIAYQIIEQSKPAVLAISHASNALGNIQPIESLIQFSKQFNTITVVDGAQGFLHLQPNLKDIDCDFYVLSAHKALGPTGLGALYGKYEALCALPVYQTGGEMIDTVTFEHTTFALPPAKFEAGTPNISAVIAFKKSLEYLDSYSHEHVRKYELDMFNYLVKSLLKIEGIKIYGDLNNNIGTVSFNYKEEHPYDIAHLLDQNGIAVRSGHHCTQPLMAHLKVSGTVRVRLAFYNNYQDIDLFICALKTAISLLD